MATAPKDYPWKNLIKKLIVTLARNLSYFSENRGTDYALGGGRK
jgi:hypothetical protein